MKLKTEQHADDNHKVTQIRELQRRKWLATGALVFCFVVMIVAKILEAHYPTYIAIGVVAAFAEAATIGGIADWYAVVALLGRPLKLSLPHTDIVRSNQPRIADNLGRFLEENFLSREQIGARLCEINFVAEIANQLSDLEKSRSTAQFIARVVPQVLEAMPQKRLLAFAGDRLTAQLVKMDIAPLVGYMLKSFTKDGRLQWLLDDGIRMLHKFLHDEETLETIRQKIQKEVPFLLRIFPVDETIRSRLLRAMRELLSEIKDDPDHAFRNKFEEFILDFLDRMRSSENFVRRMDEIKALILARPEFGGMAERAWQSLTEYVLEEVAKEDSVLVAGLAELFVDFCERLKTEEELSADINAGIVTLLSELVEVQKSAISGYVADEVRRWDPDQLVSQIDANVGCDLQFIRLNGMIVGGIVGVILHFVIHFLPF